MTRRELQAAVQAARSGRRRAWLDADLKIALGAYSAERRAAGVRWADLAAELGVGETQLRKWSGVPSRRRSKLRPVEIITAPSTPSISSLCLELPGAARVTGLSVADVAALLRALQ